MPRRTTYERHQSCQPGKTAIYFVEISIAGDRSGCCAPDYGRPGGRGDRTDFFTLSQKLYVSLQQMTVPNLQIINPDGHDAFQVLLII